MTKYHAKRTQVGDLTFDSAAEARRYGELLLLNRAKVIRNLELQPRFPVIVNGVKICTYVADFAYCEDGCRTVEDVKSEPTKTAVYRLKKKLVEACYPGIKIKEVTA